MNTNNQKLYSNTNRRNSYRWQAPQPNTCKETLKLGSVDILTSPVKELIACLLLELFASLHTNSNGILFSPGSLSAFKPFSAQNHISWLYTLTNSPYCKYNCMSKPHTCAWHQYTKVDYVCLKCLSACSQLRPASVSRYTI